jgi:Cupin
MDALSKILESIKLRGVVYRKLEVTAPWGIDLPKSQFLQFWKLLDGPCCLQLEKNGSIQLAHGDLVLIPNGGHHLLSDKADSSKIPLKTFIKYRDTDNPYFLNGDAKTTLVGGHFEFDSLFLHPLITTLPNLIHLKGTSTQAIAIADSSLPYFYGGTKFRDSYWFNAVLLRGYQHLLQYDKEMLARFAWLDRKNILAHQQ